MIYLLRHCKALGQEQDANLTSEGSKRAQNIVSRLENLNVQKVYSSPMKRAIKTVEPFAIQNNRVIHIDDRLSERILTTEYMDDFLFYLEQTFNDYNLKFKGGESSNEALDRVLNFINETKTNQTMLIVFHGNLMALLLNHFGKFSYKDWENLKNPDLWHIDDNEEIERINL